MLINPDNRFEKALNEKTAEQLIKGIRVLKREIQRLKHVVEEETDNTEIQYFSVHRLRSNLP